MTVLLYIAITKPNWYKAIMTLRNCLWLMVAIWLLSSLVAAPIGIYGTTMFLPVSAPLNCDVATCQRLFTFIFVIVYVICSTAVIGFYAILLAKIKHRLHSDSTSSLAKVSFHNDNINICIYRVSQKEPATFENLNLHTDFDNVP